MVYVLFLVSAVVLGACIGSFLNVVIYRVPAGTFFKGGHRSHCPACGAPIVWYDNIPVLSWTLLLRGKARCCGAKISMRYPFVEVLTAALMALLYIHVFPAELALKVGQNWIQFGFQAWFVAILIACTFIDIDHRILPNVLTKPTMVVGLAGAPLGMTAWYVMAPPDPFGAFLWACGGLAAGYGLTEGVRQAASFAFQREAMGYGDVKFMAAVGAFVGWQGVLITFFIGCISGAIYGLLHQWIKKENKIFFGPFLALGAWIALHYRSEIWTFVTVTWPNWQREVVVSPWVSIGVAVTCLVLLFLLIRNARRKS